MPYKTVYLIAAANVVQTIESCWKLFDLGGKQVLT